MSLVVITGGGSGMGFAAAKMIGSQGHRILITGRNKKRLESAAATLKEEGIVCDTFVCDVSNKSEVEQLAEKATSLGEIYALVNAAGVDPARADYRMEIAVNAMGTLYTNEIFSKVIMRGGCIVNVASICAYMIPSFLRPARYFKLAFSDPGKLQKKLTSLSRIAGKKKADDIAYAISKSFVVYYTKAAAEKSYDGNEIRIVSISPSNIDTHMGNAHARNDPEELKKYLDNQAIQKPGKPENVAFLIASLIDPRMGIVTAADIMIDGGWHGYNHGKIRF